jgi:O-acetyl-ADP-ribose deacetylase (regulator of RNase III)
MTHRIGNSVVKVISGDICESKCEVIVSSDDSRLSQGGGVSRAIALAGGEDIRRQIANLTPVDLGDVAITTAGNLPQKYIFHAVTIDLERSRVIDEDLQDFIVRNSVRRCFQLMSVLKLSSIAFPIVGAGVAGIPAERAGRRMAEIFAEELGRMNRGLSVELWIFGVSTGLADSIFCDIIGTSKKEVGLLSSALIDNASSGMAGAAGITSAAIAAGGLARAGAVIPAALMIGDAVAKYIKGKSKKQKEHDWVAAQVENDNKAFPDDDSTREVFISYSRSDSAEADWICEVLRAAGISYWRDVDGTYSGQNFKGVIVGAIRMAHTVLFLSSKNSNASDNVVGEIGAALHFRKRIVPIKLDAAEYHDNLLMDMLYLDNIDVNVLGRAKSAEKIQKVVLLNRANSDFGEES